MIRQAISVFRMLFLTAALAGTVLLTSCGSAKDPYAGRAASDLSGYAEMQAYRGEVALVETDVDEILELMDQGATFVFFAGYADCPWCNRLIPYLNEIALREGRHIGYLDTRKDPSWENNTDLEGYDRLVERFGDYFDTDDSGSPHLYVPDTFFIRDGVIAARHDGVLEGADDPDVPLTEEQEKSLRELLRDEFKTLNG